MLAERVEESPAAEQRALPQLRDECARPKQRDYSFHKLRVDLETLKLDFRTRETELQKKTCILKKLEKEARSLSPLRLLLDAAQVAKQDMELDLLRPQTKEYHSAQNLIDAQTLHLRGQRQLREDLLKARECNIEFATDQLLPDAGVVTHGRRPQ